jgi:1-acyl-sn-glycerol-3-phosphate acyltransferase
VASCAEGLKDGGHLLGLSPGGVYEAQFSDHNYRIMWKNRLGFAKIAIEAQVPIIPVFTQNVREAFRAVLIHPPTMKKFYEATRYNVCICFYIIGCDVL